jgi:hypothetical membrane protein
MAGIAAVAAPVLMWGEFLTVGLTRHGYNLLTRPFSDLATMGTQNSTFFDVGFFLVPGALTMLVGLGLLYEAGLGHTWRAGALLVVGAGVFLLLTGVFRQDPTSASAGYLHGTVSQICFGLAAVAPILLFIGSGGLRDGAPPRRIWLAVAMAATTLELFGVLVRPGTCPTASSSGPSPWPSPCSSSPPRSGC